MEVRLNPVAAFVWSFLWPGLGQLYNGQKRHALLWLASPILALLIFMLTARGTGPTGFYVAYAVGPAIRLLAAIDAARFARRTTFSTRTAFRSPLGLLVLLCALYGLTWGASVATYDRWPVRSFFIPSGAMIPTLMINDYILVDHWATTGLNDVVVFQPPDSYEGDKPDLVKRIVAVGGDKVEVRDGFLWRNGEKIPELWVREPIDGNLAPVTVPPGHFFAMGDNRNNSSDSRVFGPVPFANIVGRVNYIFWPFERAQKL